MIRCLQISFNALPAGLQFYNLSDDLTYKGEAAGAMNGFKSKAGIPTLW